MSFDLKITNRDIIISNGDLKTVRDSEKLIQDVLKIALTEVGSNPLNTWYGSFLSRTMIGNALDTGIIVQIGQSQLQTALENLKSLQNIQSKSFQRISADEQISAIKNIAIIRSQDPRLFSVVITIITKGFKPITTSFNISTI
jgi:phage baseplate assembly protein W